MVRNYNSLFLMQKPTFTLVGPVGDIHPGLTDKNKARPDLNEYLQVFNFVFDFKIWS